MPKRPTIKTIAKDLGISHMTVSRALADSPLVQPKTKKRILGRANELGYVRSEAAVAMRGDATNLVGLVLPNIQDEFYSGIANALSRACNEVGLHLVIHLSGDDQATEIQLYQRLRAVHAFAVCVVPSPGDALEYPDDLICVELVRRRGSPYSHLVTDEAALAEAVTHLVAQGHRRISFICAHKGLSTGRERFAAFSTALVQTGIPVDEALVLRGLPSKKLGYGFRELINSDNPPSAIICGGAEISAGALAAVMDAGTSMPDQMAFIGYGDPEYYQWIQGGITTIKVPMNKFSESLAARLAELREPQSAEKRKLELSFATPAELILRKSA